jgi:hypothetical protein
LLRSAVFLEKTFKVYGLEFAEAITSRRLFGNICSAQLASVSLSQRGAELMSDKNDKEETKMAKRKGSETTGTKPEPGLLELTGVNALPERAVQAQWWIGGYNYRYTTGPFSLPQNSGSLDWILLNNDARQQEARVTVFKCPIQGTISRGVLDTCPT